MNKVYYGAAIQGAQEFGKRAHVHKALIDVIEKEGFEVPFKYTTATSEEEIIKLLEKDFGVLSPQHRIDRATRIRDKLIAEVEGSIVAAVFELSISSIGAGIEFAHAYQRPQVGFPEIPILVLYQKGYWPNDLSVMVRGVVLPNLKHVEYTTLNEAESCVSEFLRKL